VHIRGICDKCLGRIHRHLCSYCAMHIDHACCLRSIFKSGTLNAVVKKNSVENGELSEYESEYHWDKIETHSELEIRHRVGRNWWREDHDTMIP
jgi:hypothetical protein